MSPEDFLSYTESVLEDVNGGDLDPSDAAYALRKALEKVAL